jgi:hypothetical protein
MDQPAETPDDDALDFSNRSAAYELARRDPDRKRFRWFMLGLLGLAIVMAVIGYWLKDRWKNEGLGEWVQFGDSAVFYTYPVTEPEARAFGEYLKRVGFFDPHEKRHIQLGRDGERHVVTVFVWDKDRKGPKLREFMVAFRATLAQEFFKEKPVVLQIADPQLTGFGTAYVIEVIE